MDRNRHAGNVRDRNMRRTSLSLRVRQAQKMEIMGRFATGIVHDFHNQLHVILGYCRLLMDGLPADSPLRAHAMRIENAGESAASIATRLLTFCRDDDPDPQSLDVNEVLGNLAGPLQRLLDPEIKLSIVPAPGACLIKADRTQLEQAVLNLVLNSCDAMPRGGNLTLKAEVWRRSAGRSLPTEHVALAISDTGAGMDAQTRRRALEPFFTTKPPGRGTGLGLSMVADFIKSCGGRIEIDTKPGRGTAVRLLFRCRLE